MKYIKLFESIDIDWDDFDEDETIDDLGKLPQGLTMGEYGMYVDRVVRIRHDSEYYGDINSNPKDLDGRITGMIKKYSLVTVPVYDEYIFNVKWDNRETNQYRSKDLELV